MSADREILCALDAGLPRDGYDYPTTAEVLAGGQSRGSGLNPSALRSSRERAIDKKCPICGAEQGRVCRSISKGGRRPEPHWYRAGVR